MQVLSAQTTLPVPLHAGGRVLQSIDAETGVNATAGWNISDWQPQPQPGPGALAPIPLKSVKASSTKAVALQHLKVHTPTLLCVAPNNLCMVQATLPEAVKGCLHRILYLRCMFPVYWHGP